MLLYLDLIMSVSHYVTSPWPRHVCQSIFYLTMTSSCLPVIMLPHRYWLCLPIIMLPDVDLIISANYITSPWSHHVCQSFFYFTLTSLCLTVIMLYYLDLIMSIYICSYQSLFYFTLTSLCLTVMLYYLDLIMSIATSIFLFYHWPHHICQS